MTADQHPRAVDSSEALERLGRLSLRELSMDSLLQTVADLTEQVVHGNPEASGCLLVRDRPRSSPTGRLATGNRYACRNARGHGRRPADRAGDASGHRPGEGHPHGAVHADRRPGLPVARAGLRAQQPEVRDIADHLVHTGEFPRR